MNEKVLTKNPDPLKRGVKIDKVRYDNMRKVILALLKKHQELSSSMLIAMVVEEVERHGKVDYSVGWCAMAVKLDLEAKGEISFDRTAKKPMVRLSK